MTDRDGRDPVDVRSHREKDLARRADREEGYRRAFRLGLAASVAFHLFLLLFLGRQLHMPEPGLRETPRPAEELTGLRLTRVEVRRPEEEPVPTPPPPIRPEPAEEPEPEPAEEEAAAEAEQEAGREEAERRVSNVDALTPRQGDPRLWREFWDEDVARRYLGGASRADSALRAILREHLDSLQLSEEQLRKARDWTVTEDGERWGISPEGIHLGDITIPLPVGQLLSPTGPRRRELERELRELQAIRRQEALSEAAETREERIEAMEERAREERGEEGSPSDSTGDEEGGGRR